LKVLSARPGNIRDKGAIIDELIASSSIDVQRSAMIRHRGLIYRPNVAEEPDTEVSRRIGSDHV